MEFASRILRLSRMTGLPMTVLMAAAACADRSSATDPTTARRGQYEGWAPADSGVEVRADASTRASPRTRDAGPSEEVCDGEDNDRNGRTDEELGGASCTTEDGEQGTENCIGGRMRCAVCAPGAVRESDCGCDTSRIDTCGPDGTWRDTACDGCGQSDAPCGFCGHMSASGECIDTGSCVPGERAHRRCDACPAEGGCGASTCVGETWVCNSGCTWEKESDCAILPKECDRDATLTAPCGQCGFQALECDGCFWNREVECTELGACAPGAERVVPCSGEQCGEGFGATVTCTDSCTWGEAGACLGCTPGSRREWEPCLESHPQCGERLVEYSCTVAVAANSCNAGIGEASSSTIQECPDIECTPGQTRSCRTGSGSSSRQTCQQDCTWQPCGAEVVCVPNEVTVQTIGCGCGASYTRTRTCNGDGTGWSEARVGFENCPECTSGASDEDDCACGTRARTCNAECRWEAWGECRVPENACTNGATERRPCPHACGPAFETWSCVGCAWQVVGNCEPTGSVACDPGDTRTRSCNPDGCPQCQDICSDTCQWVEGSRPSCG